MTERPAHEHNRNGLGTISQVLHGEIHRLTLYASGRYDESKPAVSVSHTAQVELIDADAGAANGHGRGGNVSRDCHGCLSRHGGWKYCQQQKAERR